MSFVCPTCTIQKDAALEIYGDDARLKEILAQQEITEDDGVISHEDPIEHMAKHERNRVRFAAAAEALGKVNEALDALIEAER